MNITVNGGIIVQNGRRMFRFVPLKTASGLVNFLCVVGLLPGAAAVSKMGVLKTSFLLWTSICDCSPFSEFENALSRLVGWTSINLLIGIDRVEFEPEPCPAHVKTFKMCKIFNERHLTKSFKANTRVFRITSIALRTYSQLFDGFNWEWHRRINC